MPTDDGHEAHMGRAFGLAREAGERGDGPYGSVLVLDAEVVRDIRADDGLDIHREYRAV